MFGLAREGAFAHSKRGRSECGDNEGMRWTLLADEEPEAGSQELWTGTILVSDSVPAPVTASPASDLSWMWMTPNLRHSTQKNISCLQVRTVAYTVLIRARASELIPIRSPIWVSLTPRTPRMFSEFNHATQQPTVPFVSFPRLSTRFSLYYCHATASPFSSSSCSSPRKSLLIVI